MHTYVCIIHTPVSLIHCCNVVTDECVIFLYLLSLPLSLFLPRGYVYCSREIEPGWMVWNNGRLLHRPKETEDKDGEMFCSELDSTTLKVWVC